MLEAKAQIDAAVALPIPGKLIKISGLRGSFPSYSLMTLWAIAWSARPLLLYPRPCHAERRSFKDAWDNASKEGNKLRNWEYLPSTRSVWVCCSIISETTTE